jgi:hypothetical protein
MLASRNDVLAVFDLRIALQRIGLAYWSAATVLRSWALAPVMVAEEGIHVPCHSNESLWIGFWLEDDARSAAVISVKEEASGLTGVARCPDAYQLTTLLDSLQHPYPICRDKGQIKRGFTVEVTVDAPSVDIIKDSFQLYLVEPQAWEKASGRPAPEECQTPPPLPPKLG